jgi:hypothetical protein
MTMPKPTTATIPAAAEITELSTAARRAALERWQGWADDLADGGSMPNVADVLAAGMALGIQNALDALAADAAALAAVRRLEERIRGREQYHRELLAPYGGTFTALKAEIRRVEDEAKQLRRVKASVWWDHRLGALKAQLLETKTAAPRVFPPAPPRPKRKAQKPAAATATKPQRPTRKGKANPDAVDAL